MELAQGFLEGHTRRQLSLAGCTDLQPFGLFVGNGTSALEVAVAEAVLVPSSQTMREVWKKRRAGRASPLLLVVVHPDGVCLCGVTGENPPIYKTNDRGIVERICVDALSAADRHTAINLLANTLPTLETPLAGLTNQGFVARHELEKGVPSRSDWNSAGKKAIAIRGCRGEQLLGALGYKVENSGNNIKLLSGQQGNIALAVLIEDGELPEVGTQRFSNLSPVSYALARADDEKLRWAILIQDTRLRLYSTRVDDGVGRRGRTETFIECQLSLLSDDKLPYAWLLFSADALGQDGSLCEILEASRRFAGELAGGLRDRIYEQVIPILAMEVVKAQDIDKPNSESLALAYEIAMTILFRLLFIAYAEDRDLLPYTTSDLYKQNSLKQIAGELAEHARQNTLIPEGNSLWERVSLLWHAVAKGNSKWGVVPYNGGLFTENQNVSAAGAEIARIHMPNQPFAEALSSLLVTNTDEGVPGAIDFRSLGVREFGTIYEGLLESELAVASVDLAVSKKSEYIPTTEPSKVEVQAGAVYLHNRSGSRKSSGSYYTKSFVVEHLLDGALEPALKAHFDRLVSMNPTDAAEEFFNFRVADIAMGSGHFLVAAIDRIEKRMAEFLVANNLPGVRKELFKLRSATQERLGEMAGAKAIEDGSLLRRLIARRCIYGVDLNELSVQLARLAIWIHTFVPGLPLSMLDHNLVCGNSLIGIGTIDEIDRRVEQQTGSLFHADAEELLGAARAALQRLANINDTSIEDIARARESMLEAERAIQSTKDLCNIIVAQPVTCHNSIKYFQFGKWNQHKNQKATHLVAQEAYREMFDLKPFHFPVAFPEVFLRARRGFDVILGNPPWEEATVEQDAFWARFSPGLRGMPQRVQEQVKKRLREERPDLVGMYELEVKRMKRMRSVLIRGDYPGIGTGDPDLYKAFCWRFWNLSVGGGGGGAIGVVLPYSAFSGKGLSEFRTKSFREATSVSIVVVQNNKEWIFENVASNYMIAFVCIARNNNKTSTNEDDDDKQIHIRGPFKTLDDFDIGVKSSGLPIAVNQVRSLNEAYTLPRLSGEQSLAVLLQMRAAPRLDLNIATQWRIRPHTELHATNQKYLMDLASEECPNGYWPVYKGKSFELWNPDTRTYYAYADPKVVKEWLQEKRVGGKGKRGQFSDEFSIGHRADPSTLACNWARVAFRDITSPDASRTVHATLIPPRVFLANTAPYFLWPRGDEKDMAFLIGVLGSMPLDWYVRRFVNLHLSFFIINPLPVPRPPRGSPGWSRVVELAGRLSCPDDRFQEWASTVGVECGPVAERYKAEAIHEMDALVALLYGLSKSQLKHIIETYRDGWEFDAVQQNVLRYYGEWNGKI